MKPTILTNLCRILSIPEKTNRKHQLPRALIGYTASFLPQMDYVKFAMSNRSIYLGCNSPNLLPELDLTIIEDCSSINLATFASVKTLSIELPNAIESTLNWNFDSPKFKQANTLKIYANKTHG
eukprot:383616_1